MDEKRVDDEKIIGMRKNIVKNKVEIKTFSNEKKRYKKFIIVWRLHGIYRNCVMIIARGELSSSTRVLASLA